MLVLPFCGGYGLRVLLGSFLLGNECWFTLGQNVFVLLFYLFIFNLHNESFSKISFVRFT